MAARYRLETTVWYKAPTTPNHIYITEGSYLIGFIPYDGEEIRFSQPKKQWSVSRRTFRDLTKEEIRTGVIKNRAPNPSKINKLSTLEMFM